MTEIRTNPDGSLDEVVGIGQFHLEQMDSGHWWMLLNGVHVNLTTRKNAKITATVIDDRPYHDAPRPADVTAVCASLTHLAEQRAAKKGGAIICTPEAQARMMIHRLANALAERDAWLAECYRQSGADPDGDEDWRLALEAVKEVTRLRTESDAAHQATLDVIESFLHTPTICLHAGEMTAQELRSVKAIVRLIANRIRKA